MPHSRPVAVVAAVVAAVVVVVAAGVAGVVGGDGGGAAAGDGPTALASTRDLATTLETTGRVERSWQRTVSYAAALPRPAAPGGSQPGGSLGDGATASTPSALTLASSQEAPPATPGTTAPAADPSPPTAPPAADPTAPPDTSDPTAPAESTAPVADPTAPATTGTTTPTTAPTGARTDQQPPPTPVTTTPTTAPVEAAGDDDPALLTAVAALGSAVADGTVLYAADDEPVVALTGAVPAWRTLEAGVDGGVDVRQLEDALVALGHGGGLTVDEGFTAATAAAVERWEAALGRAEPDGVVEVGDVVFVAEAGTVLAQQATVGDPLEPGTPVLLVGSRTQRLSATVAAGEAAAWAAGSAVGLTWSDGSTTTGTVAGVGRQVSEGTVELTVALSEADAARPTGAEASIATVDARREGAVTVPVSALVAGPDGTPAVRRPAGPGRPDRVVPVTTGIVAGTRVEVVAGLAPGDAVRLPG